MTRTVEITISNGDRFNVEYKVVNLEAGLGKYIDIEKVSIGVYELEFYSLKILQEDVYKEILAACENSYQNTKDDLQHVNIG
jgi:hypothetical protein